MTIEIDTSYIPIFLHIFSIKIQKTQCIRILYTWVIIKTVGVLSMYNVVIIITIIVMIIIPAALLFACFYMKMVSVILYGKILYIKY